MSRTGWLDVSNGVAGDMILGALVSAGVPLDIMAHALRPLELPITLHADDVSRGGLASVKVSVSFPTTDQPTRTWREVRDMLTRLEDPLRGTAQSVFAALADAEASVHGTEPEQVHFHEVGALDAIADIVATCAGLHALALDRLVVTPIALGGGTARTAHGSIPVPVPAVLALLRAARAPGRSGPDEFEVSTPTGVALVTTLASDFGPMPDMTPTAIGVGAGTRDPHHRPNVVRLVVGDRADAATESAPGSAVVLETNVDDMDPRLWPGVIAALIEAGAGDAWLVPIAMKKGRPAHTLCAIVSADRSAAVRAVMFRETTTIGIRETRVAKHALHREFRTVEVDAHAISVKLGVLPDGQIVNASAEWDDVARAAEELGRPAKQVLAQAVGRASGLTDRSVKGNPWG